MKKIAVLCLFLLGFAMAGSFLDEQKKYERVRTALEEKSQIVLKSLSDENIDADKLDILFIAYKSEAVFF